MSDGFRARASNALLAHRTRAPTGEMYESDSREGRENEKTQRSFRIGLMRFRATRCMKLGPSSLRALLGEAIQLGAAKKAGSLRREGLLAMTALCWQVFFTRDAPIPQLAAVQQFRSPRMPPYAGRA